MFIGATVHGALWINNHVTFDLQILGEQKETSGIAAYALLCIIILIAALHLKLQQRPSKLEAEAS